jgi:hypothetical protein
MTAERKIDSFKLNTEMLFIKTARYLAATKNQDLIEKIKKQEKVSEVASSSDFAIISTQAQENEQDQDQLEIIPSDTPGKVKIRYSLLNADGIVDENNQFISAEVPGKDLVMAAEYYIHKQSH